MQAPAEAWSILNTADVVCSEAEVDAAITRVADALTERYRDKYPVVICVMNGAVFFCGRLLGQLRFPLTLDYLHATRYGPKTSGGKIDWHVLPHAEVIEGRDVVIVDDILDAGETLRAIREKILESGALSCTIAVLANKLTGQAKPLAADFVGLDIPDRFVFGCGLDVAGYWRNLAAIYAVKGK